MAVVDARGLPIGLRVFSAGEHEVRQAEETLFSCWSGYLPERVIADRGFDSDALDASPADLGVDMIHARVDMIVPHRKNRKLRTQDGRKLRRYRSCAGTGEQEKMEGGATLCLAREFPAPLGGT
jgi:hypothetical protein